MIELTKIIAVVVTYNPNMQSLSDLIEATSPQVSSVIIVDNSPEPDPLMQDLVSDFGNLELIRMGKNMGIAYAQNIGIEHCIACKADYALLLDQDSLPLPDMVDKLASALIMANHRGIKVAAAAPVTIDSRTNVKSYFIVSKYGVPYRYKPKNKPDYDLLVKTGFVISSGSLISLKAISKIGGKRSGYFIDHVDTEWCFRARNAGYSLIGVHDAYLNHSLGDTVKSVWLFYLRYIPYHSPLRDYYMFRNTIFCIRDTEGVIIWKLLLIFRLFQFFIYFGLFASRRLNRVSMMFLGLYHGLIKKDGFLDLTSRKCHVIPKTKIDPV